MPLRKLFHVVTGFDHLATILYDAVMQPRTPNEPGRATLSRRKHDRRFLTFVSVAAMIGPLGVHGYAFAGVTIVGPLKLTVSAGKNHRFSP